MAAGGVSSLTGASVQTLPRRTNEHCLLVDRSAKKSNRPGAVAVFLIRSSACWRRAFRVAFPEHHGGRAGNFRCTSGSVADIARGATYVEGREFSGVRPIDLGVNLVLVIRDDQVEHVSGLSLLQSHCSSLSVTRSKTTLTA